MAWTALHTNTNALYQPVNQVGHNFQVGHVVRYNGTAFVLAQADSLNNSIISLMVSNRVNADQFYITQAGKVDGITTQVLTPGAFYYLDPANAGELTPVEPSSPDIIVPCFRAVTSNSGFFLGGSPTASAGGFDKYVDASAINSSYLLMYELTGSGTNGIQLWGPTAVNTDNTRLQLIDTGDGSTGFIPTYFETESTTVPEQFEYVPVSGAAESPSILYRIGTLNFPRSIPANHYALPVAATGRDGVGVAVADDTLYATLIYLPAASYDNVIINVITADAAATVDIGIYLMNAVLNGNPISSRVVDCGTIADVSSTGEKILSFASTPLAGYYWIIVRPDNIAVALELDVCAGTNFNWLNPSNTTTTPVYGYQYNGQTSLPAFLGITVPDAYFGLDEQIHIALQAT